MKATYILYLGIFLLLVGLGLKYLTPFSDLGIGFIIIGVVLKMSYVLFSAIKGSYKPGREIIFLILGLCFLFLGLWHKFNVNEFVGYAMIFLSICLKILFVLLFIRKTKRQNTLINS